MLGRSDVKIISRSNLLIIIVKNEVEIAKLSQITSLDGIAANAHVAARPKYCESAARVIKNISGSKVDSSVVVLSFQDEIPDRVS